MFSERRLRGTACSCCRSSADVVHPQIFRASREAREDCIMMTSYRVRVFKSRRVRWMGHVVDVER
jgi:hypothetical protein